MGQHQRPQLLRPDRFALRVLLPWNWALQAALFPWRTTSLLAFRWVEIAYRSGAVGTAVPADCTYAALAALQ